MGLQYDFYPTPSPINKEGETKLHARAITNGTISTDGLAELISSATSLSPADLKAALVALADTMTSELKNGRRVHLEGLGYFNLTLTCEPISSPKEIRAESVSVKNIVFRPEANWRKSFRAFHPERVRVKNHSRQRTDDEITRRLTAHFASQPVITCREFCSLGGFTLSTGLRRIKQLIAEGKLRKHGYGNGSNYEATAGHYGNK